MSAGRVSWQQMLKDKNMSYKLLKEILCWAAVTASISLSGFGAGGGDSGQLAPGFGNTSVQSTAPRVSDTSPDNVETGVSMNSVVSVTFSEAMTSATIDT